MQEEKKILNSMHIVNKTVNEIILYNLEDLENEEHSDKSISIKKSNDSNDNEPLDYNSKNLLDRLKESNNLIKNKATLNIFFLI